MSSVEQAWMIINQFRRHSSHCPIAGFRAPLREN
jgi:hypothetical protein